MADWSWLLLGVLLAVAAAGVLGWCGWRVFRASVGLGRTLASCADAAAAAQGGTAAVPDPAVGRAMT